MAQCNALAGLGFDGCGVGSASNLQIRHKSNHLLDEPLVVPQVDPKVEIVGAEVHEPLENGRGTTVKEEV